MDINRTKDTHSTTINAVVIVSDYIHDHSFNESLV